MIELPARTDVAIIGGGFAGCSTAWALARRGISAVVLEREPELGRYASGRGAGLGRQLAEDDATTAWTVRGAAWLRDELAAAWSPTGGLLTFDDAAEVEVYRQRAVRHGLRTELVDRAHVLARWPALEGLPLVAGLEVASDGVIDTRVLLQRFAARAHVVLGAGVLAVEPGGAGVRVTTTRGSLDARHVVDAAGAWAGALTGDPPLAAFKRHLFVLEATPAAGLPYLWHLGRSELYVRVADGGVLATACDAVAGAPCDAQPDAAGEQQLRDVLASAAPGLARASIVRRWACQRSFTPDRQMRIGRDPDRPWLVWAAGLGGHGATASAAIGEAVAAAIDG